MKRGAMKLVVVVMCLLVVLAHARDDDDHDHDHDHKHEDDHDHGHEDDHDHGHEDDHGHGHEEKEEDDHDHGHGNEEEDDHDHDHDHGHEEEDDHDHGHDHGHGHEEEDDHDHGHGHEEEDDHEEEEITKVEDVCKFDCMKDLYEEFCGGAECVHGAKNDEEREAMCSDKCLDVLFGSPVIKCLEINLPKGADTIDFQDFLKEGIIEYCFDGALPSEEAPSSEEAFLTAQYEQMALDLVDSDV